MEAAADFFRTADLWHELALDAEREGSLWAMRSGRAASATTSRSSRRSPTRASRSAVETIYEGYLVHYGRPRLFAPGEGDTVLLLGDYLYAHGLVRIAAAGSVDAVAAMARADLALRRAARRHGGRRRRLGRERCPARRGVLKETEDSEELLARAREAAGEDAVERSLEAHARRVG